MRERPLKNKDRECASIDRELLWHYDPGPDNRAKPGNGPLHDPPEFLYRFQTHKEIFSFGNDYLFSKPALTIGEILFIPGLKRYGSIIVNQRRKVDNNIINLTNVSFNGKLKNLRKGE